MNDFERFVGLLGFTRYPRNVYLLHGRGAENIPLHVRTVMQNLVDKTGLGEEKVCYFGVDSNYVNADRVYVIGIDSKRFYSYSYSYNSGHRTSFVSYKPPATLLTLDKLAACGFTYKESLEMHKTRALLHAFEHEVEEIPLLVVPSYYIRLGDIGMGYELTKIKNLALNESNKKQPPSYYTPGFYDEYYTAFEVIFNKDISLPDVEEVIQHLDKELFEPVTNTGCKRAVESLKSSGKWDELTWLEKHKIAILVYRANITRNKVKLSTTLNKLFGEDVETIKEYLSLVSPAIGEDDDPLARWPADIKVFSSTKRNKNQAIFRKYIELEALELPENSVLAELIESEEIPLTLFTASSNEEYYFLRNNQWYLWKTALARDKEEIIKIAKAASRRKTYTKDLMSYFYFIYHRLPAYLKRHSGQDWTVKPFLVDKLDKDVQPIKTNRGVMTPIADNVNKIVYMPYCSYITYGRRDQYCYSHRYVVLEEGLDIDGHIVDKETIKLNKRDDYGLMYYTLTGTYTARGYPTFLIIFENRHDGEIHLHFHRSNPYRTKNGETNPVNTWIETCGAWIFGGRDLKTLEHEQGDILCFNVDSLPRNIDDSGVYENTTITGFENHQLQVPVNFYTYLATNDKYKLGYLVLDRQETLSHPEHESVTLPAGIYEIRTVRSWEANPVSISTWSID